MSQHVQPRCANVGCTLRQSWTSLARHLKILHGLYPSATGSVHHSAKLSSLKHTPMPLSHYASPTLLPSPTNESEGWQLVSGWPKFPYFTHTTLSHIVSVNKTTELSGTTVNITMLPSGHVIFFQPVLCLV